MADNSGDLIAPTIGDRIELPLELCWREGYTKKRGVYLNCGCVHHWQVDPIGDLHFDLCIRHKVKMHMPVEMKTLIRKQGLKYV